jgi:hypothetical protein
MMAKGYKSGADILVNSSGFDVMVPTLRKTYSINPENIPKVNFTP